MPSKISRDNIFIVALLTSAAVFYLLAYRAYYVGFFNDDAFFVIGARSLLEGRYVELNHPLEPALRTYLPGYPLLLSPLVALFPNTTLPLQIFSMVLVLGGLFLFWKLCGHKPVLILAAINPLTVSLSGTVLSDIPYFFLTPLIFLVARSIWEKRDIKTWTLMMFLAQSACLFRPSGIAFGLALILSLVLTRRFKEASAGMTVALVTFASYWLVNSPTYPREFLTALTQHPWLENIRYYAHNLFVHTLFRWPGVRQESYGSVFIWLTGLFLMGVGIRAQGFKKWHLFFTLYLMIYALIHIVWTKQAGRYLLPIVPIALIYVFIGIDTLSKRPGVSWAVVITSLALAVHPLLRIARASLYEQTAINTPPLKTLEWVKTHTKPTDIFAVESDGRFYLHTGRKTVHLKKKKDAKELYDWLYLNNVQFVALFSNDFIMHTPSKNAPNDPVPLDLLNRQLEARAYFERVFQETDEESAVYRVKGRAN